jgi:glycosyltransferase involved in cell wall biosynthesis
VSSISVALCTYQGARFLGDQLASILQQDRLPDELVVCDDGSSDGTLALLHEFAARAPFAVEVVENPIRLGVTANFEAAVQRCRGEVIAFCDQDDVWEPNRLRRLEEAFLAQPEAVVAFSDAWLIDAASQRLPMRLWEAIDLGPDQRDRMARDPFGFVLSRPAVTGCTLAIRASTLDLLLPFPAEDVGSDVPVLHDWWISVALAAAGGASKVALIDEPLVHYRLHPEQCVGIPGLWLRRWVPSRFLRLRNAMVSQHRQGERLLAVAAVLDEISSRLADRNPRTQEVHLARAHLERRAALRPERSLRFSPVLRELAAGRYRAYSSGTAAALADLLRRAR